MRVVVGVRKRKVIEFHYRAALGGNGPKMFARKGTVGDS